MLVEAIKWLQLYMFIVIVMIIVTLKLVANLVANDQFFLLIFSLRGVKVRSLWYFVHWLLGSGITVAGVINIYIGLHAYHAKTSRSVKLWTILFTTEVAAIAFIYLFQDRWDYMKKQGVILGEEQITPTDHATPPRINKNQKELGVLLQMVES